ncbi:MAG: hypothetical protein AAGI49_14045 [Bacteroidota bacterium]
MKLESEAGDTLTFYTDTGGGKIIYPSAAEKLKLKVKEVKNGDEVLESVDLGKALKARQLPPTIGPNFIYRIKKPIQEEVDGMLGANWFADKIWRFDYRNQTLHWLKKVNWKELPTEHQVELGFMKNIFGKKATHFPRLPIIVGKDTIQMLFDTGATAFLSDTARTYFDGAKTAGTSFMSAAIFDNWRTNHPDWRFITKGDAMIGEDMIEVPQITIANQTVGPVWFARRKNENFSEFMSQWMDEPIQGAIGGSCFQYFSTILLDYQAELVLIEQ